MRPVMAHDLIETKAIFQHGLGTSDVKVRQVLSRPEILTVTSGDRVYEVRRLS